VRARAPRRRHFGGAGTVADWTAAGTEVTCCIVTDGDAGGFDDTLRDAMGPLRQAEQRAAAAAVGVSDVRFLGCPDGRLEPSLDLPRDLSRVIRQVRPQRVLTSSPERFWERIGASHPDHMIVGESTLRAVHLRRAEPVRHPGTADRRGPGRLDGRGGVAGGQPARLARRRRDRPGRPHHVVHTA
jgi:LmbE family N-acetylglucosaminyl deacetylase